MSNDIVQGKPLEILAQEANDEHRAALTSAQDAIQRWFRIGGLLLEARNQVSGRWGSWCKKNLVFSRRMADNYVRVAEHKELLLSNEKRVSHLNENPSIRTAIKLLAEPKPKKERAPKKPAPAAPSREIAPPPPESDLSVINRVFGTSYASLEEAKAAHSVDLRDSRVFAMSSWLPKNLLDQYSTLSREEIYEQAVELSKARKVKPLAVFTSTDLIYWVDAIKVYLRNPNDFGKLENRNL